MILPNQARHNEPGVNEQLTTPDEFTQQWIRLLDVLETQVMENDPAAPAWTPPVGLGAMPTALRERAARVAAVQADAIAGLHESLAAAAADLATAAPPRQTTSAVYLDVMG